MPPLKRLEPYLHIFVLSALVFAHPLLELLVQQPEFFVVQQWNLAAIRLLALGLVFLLPLIPAALRAVIELGWPHAAQWFDCAWIALIVWLLTLQVANPATTNLIGDHPTMLVAVAAALLASWGTRRFQIARSFTSYLTPALIAVPLSFLLNPGIQHLRIELEEVEPSGVQVPHRFPIIFLLFDSLSTTALVDRDLAINPRRFPHLAALVGDSTWFPNTSSISHWTKEALPALLTGKYPKLGQLPRLADHPQNLFTLLHDSYRIVSSDLFYPLCPQHINALPQPVETLRERLRSRVAALTLVYLHRTFPPKYILHLPRIDQGWGTFLESDPENGPLPQFHTFLNALERNPDPTLYFHHAIFPHRPYQVLPSGKIFDRNPYRSRTDSDLRNLGRLPLESEIHLYKEYLLQTGYVDQMVGDLVTRLRDLDLYDQSLIILTSDHGSRTFPAHLPHDMFSIPLLIKEPHQKDSRIVLDAVSNLDLVPSLIDLLGIESPWKMDGSSFFSPDYQPPTQVLVSSLPRAPHSDLPASRQAMVDWKIRHFGLGEDPLQLYRAGAPYPDLLGRPLTKFSIVSDPSLRIDLELGGPEIIFDPTSDFVPAILRGRVRGERPSTGLFKVAVSINGVLEANATTRLHKPSNEYRFRLTVPPTSYRTGSNDVRVWVIDEEIPLRLVSPQLLETTPMEENPDYGEENAQPTT